MCFPKIMEEILPPYDEDGTVIDYDKQAGTDYLNSLPQHVENVENEKLYKLGLLGFIYETNDEVIVIFINEEAEHFCSQHPELLA